MKTIKSLTEAELAEYPKLPTGWQWTRLGEIADNVQYGYTESSTDEPIGPKFLRITDIQNNEVIWKTVPYCKIDDAKKQNYLLKGGDLVFARTGATVGKSYLLKGDFPESVFASYLIRVRLLKEVSESFVYNFFQSLIYWKQITEGQVGIGQPNVNGTKLSLLIVPVAPLPEQRAIVSKIEQLFSELDNGISNLKLVQEQLKVYRQAVLKKAFEGELTKKWREQQTDLPDAEDLLDQIRKGREEAAKISSKKLNKINSFTDMELATLPIIPKEWMWVKLDYLGDLGRGKSKHRPRNDKILFGGKYPFIQTGEVKASNHTIKSFEKTYSDFGLAQSKLWPKGTLCITIAANIAETAFLGFEGCFPDSIVGFTATESLVVKEYVYYFFKGNQSKIEAFAPATAQKNINLNTLQNLIIPSCSLPEQRAIIQEIETRLSVCDKVEQDIETNLEKAEALRQSILKKAFEGKLLNERELAEVRGAEDWEPAEVLLEKIRVERTRK